MTHAMINLTHVDGQQEPLVRDIDLAVELGFVDRPRDVRKLVRRMLADGRLGVVRVVTERQSLRMPTGGIRETDVDVFMLTLTQCLLVRAASSMKSPHGFVYFARSSNGLIKIGFATDVEKRLRGLSLASADGSVTLLLAMPGTKQDEAVFHGTFARYRKHGEWFEPGQALLDFIRSNALFS